MKATGRRRHWAKMTIEVFTVDRKGRVVEHRGIVYVPDAAGPLPLFDGYPPCACPRCRNRRVVTR